MALQERIQRRTPEVALEGGFNRGTRPVDQLPMPAHALQPGIAVTPRREVMPKIEPTQEQINEMLSNLRQKLPISPLDAAIILALKKEDDLSAFREASVERYHIETSKVTPQSNTDLRKPGIGW